MCALFFFVHQLNLDKIRMEKLQQLQMYKQNCKAKCSKMNTTQLNYNFPLELKCWNSKNVCPLLPRCAFLPHTLSPSLVLFLYNIIQTYIAASLPAMGIEYSLYL